MQHQCSHSSNGTHAPFLCTAILSLNTCFGIVMRQTVVPNQDSTKEVIHLDAFFTSILIRSKETLNAVVVGGIYFLHGLYWYGADARMQVAYVRPIVGTRIELHIPTIPFANYALEKSDLMTTGKEAYPSSPLSKKVFIARLLPQQDSFPSNQDPETIVAILPDIDSLTETCFIHQRQTQLSSAILQSNDGTELQIHVQQARTGLLQWVTLTKLGPEVAKQLQLTNQQWVGLGPMIYRHLNGTLVCTLDRARTSKLGKPYHFSVAGICFAYSVLEVNVARTVRLAGVPISLEQATFLYQTYYTSNTMVSANLDQADAINLFTCEPSIVHKCFGYEGMEFILVANHPLEQIKDSSTVVLAIYAMLGQQQQQAVAAVDYVPLITTILSK